MHDESIMLVLKKTNKKIIKMLSNRYKEMNLDITPNQSKILMFIYNNKEVEAKEIGDRVHTNKSSLSKVLNNLENKGYITRTGDKDDTIKKIIRLANKGLKVVEIIESDAMIIGKELMKGINKEEYSTFKSVLEKVEDNIERMTV